MAKKNHKKTPKVVANILPKLKFSHCKHCTPVPDKEEEEEEEDEEEKEDKEEEEEGCDVQN